MKINFKLAIVLFLVVITMQNVLAIGITPGRTTITYDNSDKEFFFTVLNSGTDMDLSFSTSGDLGKYIVLDKTSATFKPEDESKTFRFTLNIGDNFKTPGIYEGKIIITQKTKNEQGAGVSLAVSTQVALKVTEASIELKKTSFSVQQEKSMQKVFGFNAILLFILLIALIFVLFKTFQLNKKRKHQKHGYK